MVNTCKKHAKNITKTRTNDSDKNLKLKKIRKNAIDSNTKKHKNTFTNISNGINHIKNTVSNTGLSIFDKINQWPGIFPSFKSTNKIFAFILNSLAIGISAAIGILIHDKMTQSKLEFLKENTWIKYVVSGFGALCAAFLTYLLMLFLFGFGGGMLVNSP